MISLNEVGGRPDLFGHTKTEFHHFNKEKLAKWPLGLLPSSTHDTKFSEDVHFRLNVLTEIPHLFEEKVNAWKTHNKKYKKRIKNSLFPDLNTEYFIYQLLLGIPFFLDKDRVWQSVLKAIREAGIYTSWHLPHAAYENSVRDFLFDLITEGKENLFYPSFVQFQEKIALYGYWNSLSALVLKIGSCGIVDIYQGCETWNFSLVDPDNRKKIDYATEKTALQNKHQIEALFENPSKTPLKLLITKRALNFRRMHKELFLKGEYIPLKTSEEVSEYVIAFIRKTKDKVSIIIAARFFSALTAKSKLPIGAECWGKASLFLPENLEIEFFDHIFTEKTLKTQKNSLLLADIFESLPFAILYPS